MFPDKTRLFVSQLNVDFPAWAKQSISFAVCATKALAIDRILRNDSLARTGQRTKLPRGPPVRLTHSPTDKSSYRPDTRSLISSIADITEEKYPGACLLGTHNQHRFNIVGDCGHYGGEVPGRLSFRGPQSGLVPARFRVLTFYISPAVRTAAKPSRDETVPTSAHQWEL